MKTSAPYTRHSILLPLLALLVLSMSPGRTEAAQPAKVYTPAKSAKVYTPAQPIKVYTPAQPAQVYTPVDSTTGLFSIGPRFGTTGLGIDLAFPLGESTRLRLIGSMGNFSYNGDISDIEYAIDLSTPTLGGVLDWHPGGGAFRLSIGGFYSGIEADGSARPTDSVDIGDGTFTPAEVGVLDAKLKYPAGMGYVGFGFGDAFKGNRWTVSLDVGALLGPSPDFSLVSRDGLLSEYSAFQEEVAREEQQVRDDVTDSLRFYPVITLGLSFRF